MANELELAFSATNLLKAGFAAGTAFVGVRMAIRKMGEDIKYLKGKVREQEMFQNRAQQIISTLVNFHEANHNGQKIHVSFNGGKN